MSYGVNAPWGLRPMQERGSGAWDNVTQYSIPSLSPQTLYRGDLVAVDENGYLVPFIPFTAKNGGGTSEKSALPQRSNYPVGVFMGCAYAVTAIQNPTNLYQMNPVWIGGTVTYGNQPAVAYVIDDPMAIFNIQCGGNTNPVLLGAVPPGSVAMTAGQTGGSLTTGQSGIYLDMQTNIPINNPDTTGDNPYQAWFPLKVVGAVQVPGNVYGIPYLNLKVSLNSMAYSAGQVGV